MMDFWPSRQSAIHQVLVSVHFAFQKSDPIVLLNIKRLFNGSSIEQASQRLRQSLRQRAGPGQPRPIMSISAKYLRQSSRFEQK